jgi:hypothetical protein
MASHRTGLLIIRAWVEEESSERLRAQLRVITDISSGLAKTQTLAQPGAVADVVNAWLQDILAPAPHGDGCPSH